MRETRAEAIAALDELRKHVKQTGDVPDRTTTVADYLDYWVEDVVREVTPSTRAEYRKRVDRIVPHIGHVKLTELTPPHVRKMVSALDKRYASKTVSVTMEALRAALRAAVDDGIVIRNVAESVTVKRQRIAKADDALTAREVEDVLAVAAGTDVEALVWLALRYGLRIGELCDLQWRDIDLEAPSLTVRQSKTDAGVRTLPLIPEAVDQLERQAQRSVPVGHVFPSARGRRRSPQVVRRDWNRVLTLAGIEHRCRNCGTDRPCSGSVRRFHASRHTAATLLLQDGYPLEVVSAVLGHSSIKVTSDIYARVGMDMMRRALNRE